MRYSRKHGRRPIISLKTHEGALLAGDDVIKVAVRTNEEVDFGLIVVLTLDFCPRYLIRNDFDKKLCESDQVAEFSFWYLFSIVFN